MLIDLIILSTMPQYKYLCHACYCKFIATILSIKFAFYKKLLNDINILYGTPCIDRVLYINIFIDKLSMKKE